MLSKIHSYRLLFRRFLHMLMFHNYSTNQNLIISFISHLYNMIVMYIFLSEVIFYFDLSFCQLFYYLQATPVLVARY